MSYKLYRLRSAIYLALFVAIVALAGLSLLSQTALADQSFSGAVYLPVIFRPAGGTVPTP